MGWKVGDKEKMPEEIRKKISEKQKAASHTWHTGKKPCDARTFADAYNLLIESGMNWKAAMEIVGMPRSTFKLWVKKFEQDGKLNGDRFTDGKPVYLNRVPIFPNSMATKKKAALKRLAREE